MANKKNRVEISLTDEQIEKLAPLLKIAKKNSMQGCIFAQAWPEFETIVFKWMRPNEIREAIEQIQNQDKKIITPAKS